MTANDYYPFGMGMPGRRYGQGGKNYRYSINGQEREKELSENITSAEYWMHDSRVGRRWNVDPIVKEHESPYAVFANNPIWNIDPTGADSAKYLSNKQLIDAVEIGFNLISDLGKRGKWSMAKTGSKMSKELNEAISLYWKNHQADFNFATAAEFQSRVFEYYDGMQEVKFAGEVAWRRFTYDFSNSNIDNVSKINIVNTRISFYNGWGLNIITTASNVALGIATGGVGTSTGQGPKAPFKSNLQISSSSPRVLFEGKNVPVYRGANGSSPLFQLKGGEYKYTDQSVRGLSLHTNAPKLTNIRGDAYQITQMPKGLKIVQQGKDPGHFEIVPASKISQEDFQKLLNQIKYTKVE